MSVFGFFQQACVSPSAAGRFRPKSLAKSLGELRVVASRGALRANLPDRGSRGTIADLLKGFVRVDVAPDQDLSALPAGCDGLS